MFAVSYLSQECILPTNTKTHTHRAIHYEAILKENSQGTFKKARMAP